MVFEIITSDVKECPRCGGKHEELQFRNFTVPLVVGSSKYRYWGVCPKTNEPIIGRDAKKAVKKV
jgi:hypothetical protein